MKPFWPLGATAAASMLASAGKLRAPFTLVPALSMRQFLTLLVLSATLPMLALALFMSATMMATERQAARGGLLSNVRTLATVIDNEIDVHLAIAATLATSPQLLAGDLTAFKQQAIQALAVVPGAWLNISTPSGQIVMSTLVDDGVPLPVRHTPGPMQQAFASRQPQVSDVALGLFTKRMNAFADVPVFKDDRPLYSIILGLNPDRFLALLRNNYSPDTVVGLLDRNANFVARIPDHDRRVGTPAAKGWRAAIAESPEGFSQADTLEGEPSLTPYVKTKFGWTVGIAYLDRVALAPVRRLQWLLAFIGVALTLASLAFGFGLARKISVSMQSLMDSTLLIKDGKTIEARAFAVREVTEISRILSVTSQTIAARTAELKQSHDTFLALVQKAPFGVYLVDSELRITQLSPGAAEMFGSIEPPPVLGRKLDEVLRVIWPERFACEAIAQFQHTLETGEKYRQASMKGKRRDTGEDEAYDWQIDRVTMPGGKFGVVCYFYDLTELEQADERLRDSEVRYRMAIRAGDLGTWETDIASGLRHWSPEGMALFGLDLAGGIGRMGGGDDDELNSRVHPDDRHLHHRYERDLREAGSITAEYRIVLPNGDIRWMAGGGMVLTHDPAGDPVRSVHIATDVTERKRGEAVVRTSEVRYRRLFEAAHDGVLILDAGTGHITDANPYMLDLLDVTRAELLGQELWQIGFFGDEAASRAAFARLKKEGQIRYENLPLESKTGIRREVEVVANIYDEGGQQVIQCNVRDISERVRASKALRESEARFRGTFENAAVGVAHVRLDGRLLEVNQQMSTILGFTADELRTKTFQDITHPDDLTVDHDNVKKLLAGEIQSYTMDQRFVCSDGHYKWGGLTEALRRDASGTPLYFISIVRDITERKAAQEHQHFLLTELAHRMKNQLAVIQAMAGQTARKAGSLKEFQELFGQRLQGLAIATDILVAQGWHGAPLGELVERQLKPFIPSPDRLVCNGLKLSVTSDATQAIGLALHELATNAVKHGAWSSDRGRVIVSWQLIADGTSESQLQFVWREEGGPTVACPTRKGFGHVVIESMAAQRLGGTAELLFPTDGLHWTLTIPTTHIVADAASSPGGGGRQSDRRQVNYLNIHRTITF